jgi:hypothetical protein
MEGVNKVLNNQKIAFDNYLCYMETSYVKVGQKNDAYAVNASFYSTLWMLFFSRSFDCSGPNVRQASASRNILKVVL